MGLFSKKKNTDTPASVLSESEIRKKLYGEFIPEGERGPARDREIFLKEPSAPEVQAPADLFSTSKAAPQETSFRMPEGAASSKSAEQAPRYVPLQDFERKPVSSPEVDPYARFRYNRPAESRTAALMVWFKDLFSGLAEWVRVFSDPKHASLRRPFYWAGGILVVILLFLGVNALNSQREAAMRERFKLRGEATLPAETSVQIPEKAIAPAAVTVEREVVITPAPVRPKAATTTSPSAGSQPGGAFVIQVVTYPTKQDAEKVAGTLTREGFPSFVKEDVRPTGRVFYLVLIGGFRTEADAQAQLLKFRSKEIARPFQDAFVKSSRT